ncbi:NAD(P)/FAD-dependent oxidoreductase [Lacibacterium aquatile]|uniref:NAD(P)/FAD-dependent oxidoreductase n=1 Tax=Lacibacterium aquatile TaxID=1168082 RepID=A0ABW5DMY1_9PROT
METVDCMVVGAGVVGLAIARELALAGREVLLLEAADGIGTGVSSRNSEVIHAGLYYPAGSLKSRLCIAGRQKLYGYCAERGLPHRRLGKLVVATDESQLAALKALQESARANGAGELTFLTGDEARALEPQLSCVAALLSPNSGIIDSHALMLSLLGDLENAGGILVTGSPVVEGIVTAQGIELAIGGQEPTQVQVRTLIIAAGLESQAVAARIAGMSQESIPPLYMAKGSYFGLTGKAPFSRLIYPMPEANTAGLGTHITLDMNGRGRFGPDVEWVSEIDYRVDPARSAPFYAAIRRYWPGLPDGALFPDYSGIRPKLSGPGQAAVDFCIQGPESHGVPGLVALYGIESPGLTASLALATEIASRPDIRKGV